MIPASTQASYAKRWQGVQAINQAKIHHYLLKPWDPDCRPPDDAARARSRCGGQQLGRPQIDHTLENESESNTAGKGMLAIAKAPGVGASTVQRVKERSFIL